MSESQRGGAKTLLLVGGYGRAGLELAQLLLEKTDVRLILAGRDGERASQTALRLNAERAGDRVTGSRVDAGGARSALESAFRHCDLVTVCAPLTGFGGRVLEAALAARVDCVTLNLDSAGSAVTEELAARVERAGLRFVTDAGLFPGTPAALARWAAARFDRVHEVTASMVVRQKELSYGSALDVMESIGSPAATYDAGAWRRAPLTASKKLDFGPPLGTRSCYPFSLPELRALPEQLGLERCGAYVAGAGGLSDALVVVWALLGLGKHPGSVRLGARALVRANRFTRPPFRAAVAVEVTGESAGSRQRLRVSVQHDDGWVATAIPALSCLLQLLDGSLKQPGIQMMGHAVRVDRFVADLEQWGMKPVEAVSG